MAAHHRSHPHRGRTTRDGLVGPLAIALFLLLAPAAGASGSFSLFASYWDTDDLDETFGGGLAFGVPLGERFALDLRAGYYERLKSGNFDELLDDLFDDDESIFRENSIEIIPVEVGLRYQFTPRERVNVYVGGGLGYYLLAADRGGVDDEVGGYGLLGAQLGNPDGLSFVVEGQYRKIEGSIRNRDGELGNRDIVDEVPFDLDGVAVNAGLAWRW
ncbi:MAG TPA: outer membrane beta-barrel protein [Thermoanaerobaculia bacterium]|nr:outer membrane beta-barrel protein [Thermoanaerobaculia bacterium]